MSTRSRDQSVASNINSVSIAYLKQRATTKQKLEVLVFVQFAYIIYYWLLIEQSRKQFFGRFLPAVSSDTLRKSVKAAVDKISFSWSIPIAHKPNNAGK